MVYRGKPLQGLQRALNISFKTIRRSCSQNVGNFSGVESHQLDCVLYLYLSVVWLRLPLKFYKSPSQIILGLNMYVRLELNPE